MFIVVVVVGVVIVALSRYLSNSVEPLLSSRDISSIAMAQLSQRAKSNTFRHCSLCVA